MFEKGHEAEALKQSALAGFSLVTPRALALSKSQHDGQSLSEPSRSCGLHVDLVSLNAESTLRILDLLYSI